MSSVVEESPRNEKILFVDDEPLVLQGIQRALFGQFQTEAAEGPEAALARVEKDGPYAVVVSDMRMPVMDGAEFLSRVRGLHPDSVRVMLTGYADVDAAVRAVNDGCIFRFLNKPISPEELSTTLRLCLQQYHLVCAEKELLEKTVAGAIHVLTEVLSMANPAAFNKGARLRQYVVHITKSLGLENAWEFEIAAMLSELGCVAIPPDILEALHCGNALTPEEQEGFEKHPALAYDLIRHIPRLERAAEMVLHQNDSIAELSQFDLPETIPIRLGAQMICVSLEFDRLQEGENRAAVLQRLAQSPDRFDPKIVAALKNVQLNSDPMELREIDVWNLRPGMVLKEDLRVSGGTLLAAKGQEITRTMATSIRNFAERGLLDGTVRVLSPRAMAEAR